MYITIYCSRAEGKVIYMYINAYLINYDESFSEKRSRRGLAVSCTSQHWRCTCSLAGSSVGHRCSKLHLVGDSSPIGLKLVRSTCCHLDTRSVHPDRRRSQGVGCAETWRFVLPFSDPSSTQSNSKYRPLGSSVFHHRSRLRTGRGSSRIAPCRSCSKFDSFHNNLHQDIHFGGNSTVRLYSS